MFLSFRLIVMVFKIGLIFVPLELFTALVASIEINRDKCANKNSASVAFRLLATVAQFCS